MSVTEINTDDLRKMKGQEGLILQGCGGDISEWIDGINRELTAKGILLDNTKFDNVSVFKNKGLTCILFPFNEDIKLDGGKFPIWRMNTIEQFGSTWLSDYVDNYLGGFEGQTEEPDINIDEGQVQSL